MGDAVEGEVVCVVGAVRAAVLVVEPKRPCAAA